VFKSSLNSGFIINFAFVFLAIFSMYLWISYGGLIEYIIATSLYKSQFGFSMSSFITSSFDGLISNYINSMFDKLYCVDVLFFSM
jgi:hypothetical protein